MRRLIAANGWSVALQLAGLVVLAAGIWLIYPPAGVIAAGIGLFAVGLVIGLPARRP